LLVCGSFTRRLCFFGKHALPSFLVLNGQQTNKKPFIEKDLLFSSLFIIYFSTPAKQKTLLNNKDRQDQQHKAV